MESEADARTRTGDPFITSEVLYQLSYVGRRPTVAGLRVRFPRVRVVRQAFHVAELGRARPLGTDVFPVSNREGELLSSRSKGAFMTGQRSGNDNDRYIQPNKERGGWDVVKELHKQVSAHTETKEQAIDRARQIIKNAGGGELRIKNERGQLIDSSTIR